MWQGRRLASRQQLFHPPKHQRLERVVQLHYLQYKQQVCSREQETKGWKVQEERKMGEAGAVGVDGAAAIAVGDCTSSKGRQ